MLELFTQGGPILPIIFATSLIAWTLSIHCAFKLFTTHKTVERAMPATVHRHLALLATLTSICPLLGLLGTVIGITQAFTLIATQTDPALLMSHGISQALLTTQAGLVVALPLFLVHRILSSKLNRITQ